MDRYHLIVETLGSAWLLPAQVALATLNMHNLTATGDLEAVLSPFMGLQFRQLGLLLRRLLGTRWCQD